MTDTALQRAGRDRRFAERRSQWIANLQTQIGSLLADAGLAILIYHRRRLELEIHLLSPTGVSVVSLRDIIPSEFDTVAAQPQIDDSPIYRHLQKVTGQPLRKIQAFPLETGNGIPAMFFVYGGAGFNVLAAHVNSHFEEYRLHLQNAILVDALHRIELELELLQDTGAILSMSIRLEDVFQSIVAALEKLISFEAIGIYILREKGEAIVELFSKGYHAADSSELLRMKAGKGLVGWVAKTGEPLIVPDVLEDKRYVPARSETRSELVVPLFSGKDVIGAFNLESDRLDAYTPSDLEMVMAFANQASLSVTRARLIQETLAKNKITEQLQVAREIQKSFLPQEPPKYNGFDLDAVNISSEEVGGDYFDFIPIVDYQLGVTIADVSGKGLPASLIMASFRASLIAEIRNNYAIRTILRKVNNLICESVERGKFVTAVYGVLDVKNKIFTFANAGHNPPMLLRKNGEVEFLTTGGWTLGIQAERDYEERPIHIRSGDLLVLYTDGVTEAENKNAELFGTERLVELVKSHRDRSAKEIRSIIVSEVGRFRDADKQPDDLTLMIIKCL